MKISIITAGFRGENMNRVWESIKKQTHKDWEWVIVNDNRDSIRDWWKKFKEFKETDSCIENKDRIHFVDIDFDKGRFGLFSRNVGAMLANYKHVVFLDDDNEWTPDHLQSLVELKEKTGKHPFCWMRIVGKKEGSKVDRIKKTAFIRQHIDLGCLLWERKWFDIYGGFRDDSQVSFDWNCMARICFGEGPHQFVCTNKPTLIFSHKRY